MHELSLAHSLLELCAERLSPGQRLAAVRIAVGELASVEPDQLQFAWQAVVSNTRHAGAELEVQWHPARQTCTACGEIAERQPGTWLRLCPRCQGPLSLAGGRELDLLTIDVIDPDESAAIAAAVEISPAAAAEPCRKSP